MSPTGVLLRTSGPLTPLLKWPGGKRQELAALSSSWPTTASRFLEPFVGGGAALLATDPTVPAEVNDASDDLVALYRAIRDVDVEVFRWLDAFAIWWQRLGDLASVIDELAEVHQGGGDGAGAARSVLLRHRRVLAATVPTLDDRLATLFLEHLTSGVPRKLARMALVQRQRDTVLVDVDVRDNLEGALRAAAYTTIRSLHNAERRAGGTGAARIASFAILRDLAYAAMFRFNAGGDFNVPYGGMSYNRRDLAARVAQWREQDLAARLASTAIHHGDFADFFAAVAPSADDFVFLDPPYLSDFRDYDGNGFGPGDHLRLAAVLADLPCHFQLVIKATDEVRRWYGHDRWHCREVDKTYAWTIKNRNDRRATHLVIENR